MIFIKGISDFIKFVGLNRCIIPSAFVFHVLIKIIHNQENFLFQYCLLRDIISFSKTIDKLVDSGGLYILKYFHSLLVKVSSEHKHSLYLGLHSPTLVHMRRPCTNSIKPSPYLSSSRLALIS